MVRLRSLETLEKVRETLTTEKAQNEMKELIEYRKKVANSDGKKIQDLESSLFRSRYLVEENYSELVDIIERYESYPEPFVPEREQTNLLMEFTRHLHNFVSAAKSREHHTERILSTLDEFCTTEPLISEEYDKKREELDVGLNGVFFTGLRNIAVHEQLPIVGGQQKGHFEVGESMTVERRFYLDKNRLLESDEWSQKALGYMDVLDEQIDIKEVLKLYQEDLDSLYEWLFQRTRERFQDEFNELEELAEQTEELQEQFFSPE